ncbi:hypothetical protein [Flavobacterium sp. B17]|uniref:hypothetical protein n=1 Tax=Flavobacterium sp. B17 TaxID=95618 RepID=UPI00034A5737|nr:hypothetical protein [Flavobacterium sp. B17]
MFNRINIYKIIKAHYKSLKNLNGNGITFSDIVLFIAIPLFTSTYIGYENISIKSQISNLVTALSILAGFLFNLLAIIHNSLGKIKEENRTQISQDNSLKLKFANEIHANISYNILIAIINVVLLVLYGLNIEFPNKEVNNFFLISLNSICVFFMIHFLFTLLMILNRIYILLDKE